MTEVFVSTQTTHSFTILLHLSKILEGQERHWDSTQPTCALAVLLHIFNIRTTGAVAKCSPAPTVSTLVPATSTGFTQSACKSAVLFHVLLLFGIGAVTLSGPRRTMPVQILAWFHYHRRKNNGNLIITCIS